MLGQIENYNVVEGADDSEKVKVLYSVINVAMQNERQAQLTITRGGVTCSKTSDSVQKMVEELRRSVMGFKHFVSETVQLNTIEVNGLLNSLKVVSETPEPIGDVYSHQVQQVYVHRLNDNQDLEPTEVIQLVSGGKGVKISVYPHPQSLIEGNIYTSAITGKDTRCMIELQPSQCLSLAQTLEAMQRTMKAVQANTPNN